LPTDPQTVDNHDPTALVKLLREVEEIMTSTEYSDVVWAGDLNWDMQRNSHFSVIMRNFVARMELESLWTHHKIDFTHMHTDNKSTSTIDYFLLSPRLFQQISGAGVIHRGDNLSRHSPIWVKFDFGSLPTSHKVSGRTPIKPSWPKATTEDIEKYSTALKNKLETLPLP
jgi:hypothetical protein